MTGAICSGSQAVLPVGDPRRAPVGRAILAALIAASIFVVFAFLAKEVRSLYVASPWMNDPYDVAVSFALFFTPLVVAFVFVRIPACRRDQPLPLKRVQDLLRGTRVALSLAVIPILADWVSVGLRVRQFMWTPTTLWLVTALAFVTVVVGVAAVRLRAAAHRLEGDRVPTNGQPDWFTDAIWVAAHLRLPRRMQVLRSLVVRWVDSRVVSRIRCHPRFAAGIFSVTFGLAIAANQWIEEGVTVAAAVLFFGIAACSMYAFVLIAGSYLGLVATPRASIKPRPIRDGVIAAFVGMPLALAFRDSLGWVADTSSAHGAYALFRLLIIAGLATFLIFWAGETVVLRWSRTRRSRLIG